MRAFAVNAQQSTERVADESTRPALGRLRSGAQHGIVDRSHEGVRQLRLAETIDNAGPSVPAARDRRGLGNLPAGLRSRAELLSGHDLSDVRVHYNSSKPGLLGAHAFAQGSEIHLAAGQERHLAHEAWHVVQQRSGRVKPSFLSPGKVAVNDDPRLEREADRMGAKVRSGAIGRPKAALPAPSGSALPVQRVKVERDGEEVDVTSETPASKVIEVLGYAPAKGMWAATFSTELDEAISEALFAELQYHEEAGGQLEGLLEALEDNLPDKSGDDSPFEFLTQEEEQGRRKAAAEAFGWEAFPKVIGGLKLIGVHETKQKDVAGLTASGPSEEKIGTGHGSGKGKGFYVTPVGNKSLYNAVKGIAYEDGFVAIYVPVGFVSFSSPDPQHDSLPLLDKTFGTETPCYYLMSGKGEIVIPPRYFRLIRAFNVPPVSGDKKD